MQGITLHDLARDIARVIEQQAGVRQSSLVMRSAIGWRACLRRTVLI